MLKAILALTALAAASYADVPAATACDARCTKALKAQAKAQAKIAAQQREQYLDSKRWRKP